MINILSESFMKVNKECFHFSWLSLIAAVGSFHAGCSQHEHMGGVCMCATGIKHSELCLSHLVLLGTYMNIAMSIVWKLGSVLHTVLTTAHRERGYIEDCSWKEVNFCIVLQVLHNLKSVMTSKTMDGPKTWLGGTKNK